MDKPKDSLSAEGEKAHGLPKPIVGQAARSKARSPGMYEDRTQATLPRNVAIYVRVSTLEQAQGYSIAAQERICREFIIFEKPLPKAVSRGKRLYREE